jgi:dephospho-CoA kinase
LNIALVGRFRSGKDTAADFLVEKYNFQKFSFGSGINEVANMLFPEEMKEGKNRKLLRDIGEGMRKIKTNVWIEHCFRQIEKEGCCPNIVISDMRQMHEFVEVAKKNFIVVKVLTTKDLQIERSKSTGDSFKEEDLFHKTEDATDEIPADYILINKGTIDELYMEIKEMIRHIKENS